MKEILKSKFEPGDLVVWARRHFSSTRSVDWFGLILFEDFIGLHNNFCYEASEKFKSLSINKYGSLKKCDVEFFETRQAAWYYIVGTSKDPYSSHMQVKTPFDIKVFHGINIEKMKPNE